MATCGVWRSRPGLRVAVVDPDGSLVSTENLPPDDEGRFDWLAHCQFEHGPDLALVLPELVARYDTLGRLALERGHVVWIAPAALVEPIARAAWQRPSPSQMAALLARVPLVAALRASLRYAPGDDPRQLRLLDRTGAPCR